MPAIALTGDAAPGTDGTFESLGIPFVGGPGEVFFDGGLTVGVGTVTAADDSVTYRFAPSTGSQLLVREGDAAPGTSGQFALMFVTGAAGTGRAILFGGLLSGVGGVSPIDDFGLWRYDPVGGLSLVVRENDPAPGTLARFDGFETLPPLEVSALGGIAFRAHLRAGVAPVDPTDDDGIWGPDGGGALVLLAREGDPAPGTTGVFELLGPPALNAVDEVAFSARLLAGVGGVTSSNDHGFWGPDGAGGLALLARDGDPAPGSPPGTILQNVVVNPVALSDAGSIAFYSQLEVGPGGVTADDYTGIWGPDAMGDLTERIRRGTPVPDSTPGEYFPSPRSLAVADDGRIRFFDTPLGSSNGGFGEWTISVDGEIALLARLESPILDQSPGVVLGSNPLDTRGGSATRIFFEGRIEGPGVVPGNDDALLWADTTGVRTIVREGDSIEVAPGDFRTVQSITIGGASALDEIAYRLDFDDGSAGIFLTRLAPAVPLLPAAGAVLLVLALATAGLWSVRRIRSV